MSLIQKEIADDDLPQYNTKEEPVLSFLPKY